MLFSIVIYDRKSFIKLATCLIIIYDCKLRRVVAYPSRRNKINPGILGQTGSMTASWEIVDRICPIFKQSWLSPFMILPLLLSNFKDTTATAYHLSRYSPSSPSSKELHEQTFKIHSTLHPNEFQQLIYKTF